MKLKFLAVIAFAAVAVTGCVKTVNDDHSFATTWSQDTISARYNRTLDQVYAAAVTVVQNNGVLLQEYIPHDITNATRALTAKVNQRNVWIRVETVDPRTTQVDVQARSSWGVSDVALSSELDKQIALQLAR